MHKLFIGSFGVLGALTEVSLRVYPQPQACRTWQVACPDLATALAVGGIMRRPAEQVSALLLFRYAALPAPVARAPYSVVCTYAGAVEDVAIAETRGRRGLAAEKLPAPVSLGTAGVDLWAQTLSAALWLVRAGVAPGALPALLAAAEAAAPEAAVADLANGLLYLAGTEPAAAAPAWEVAVRGAAQATGGYALALGRGVHPPRGMGMGVEARRVAAELKWRWDPAGILNNGIFPG